MDTWSSHKQLRSPLAVVEASIEEIRRMLQRAWKANQALYFLVDLKQRQSNVLDSPSARIQAEQSLKITQEMVKMMELSVKVTEEMVNLTKETVKMNKENERQGKTLMVFTIVTIISRDDKGFLGLGYVSEILDLLKRLPRRLRIRNKRMGRSTNTHNAPKIIKIFQLMSRNAEERKSPIAKLNSQLAMEASDIPSTLVSSDQISAAYTQAIRARMRA